MTSKTIPLLTPSWLKQKILVSPVIKNNIINYRQQITDIINKKDNRLIIILGPCSVHDPIAIIDYAKRLKKLSSLVKQNIFIIMRVYFEKPRTNIGWKGFITDPYLNNSNDINQGLMLSRNILKEISELEVPIATEFLDPIISEYISDLISWGAIGARTVESQIHRSLASGLDMPIGFKNPTTGHIKLAIDAMQAASIPGLYLGISKNSKAAIINTGGNNKLQLVLRGGYNTGPNYYKQNILAAINQIKKVNLNPSIIIDCSHGNSDKNYKQQLDVIDNIKQQLCFDYSKYINGIMIESFINEGYQNLNNVNKLTYGQSVTDGCLSWVDTERAVLSLNNYLSKINKNNSINIVA